MSNPAAQLSLADFPKLKRVEVAVKVNDDAHAFQINLRDVAGEYILHFNARFSEKCVVRNSTSNGEQWQKEERGGGMPFQKGQPYKIGLEVLREEHTIEIYVNGQKFCTFALRNELNELSAIEVFGDVHDVQVVPIVPTAPSTPSAQPSVVHPMVPPPSEPSTKPIVQPGNVQGGGHGDAPHPGLISPHPSSHHASGDDVPAGQPAGQHTGLPLPYSHHLQPDFARTQRLRIVGTPLPEAKRFVVNFKAANGETLLHFNPRFDQGCVVRNSTKGGVYQQEEREGGGCPFTSGRRFALDFLVHGNTIRCFVDGIESCQFTSRDDFSAVDKLDINGDIQLEHVMVA